MSKVSSLPVTALKAHISLNVKNVEQSIEFYKKMFGIEPCKVRRGYAKFDVQNPPLNLALNQVPFNDRGALSHLGIQVGSTEDVLAVRAQWQQAELTTRDEMQTNCCYAIQDKTWVRDPDGNEWEVFVVLADNLAESSTCCATDDVVPAQMNETETCSTVNTASSSSSSCCGTTEPPVMLGLKRKVSVE
jgi:catechol 2,3-dioxygenase-like lactoylglutathione lyase family enzyme